MVLPTERGVLCVKCVCLSGGIFHNRTKPMKIWGLGLEERKELVVQFMPGRTKGPLMQEGNTCS